MSILQVLGIGSPFGDDQLGWEVVALLQEQTLSRFTKEQLHIACCDRPGMYLLELMRPAQTVFLIDAIRTGAAIGTLHCFQNEAIESIDGAFSTHAFGIAAALKMGASLQMLPKQIRLYGIEIGEIPFQFTLSKPIQQATKALALRIQTDIVSFFQ